MLSSPRNSSKKCAIQLLLSCAKAIPPRPPNCASCLAPAGVSSFHFLSALIATASPAALPTKECSRELEHRRLACEPHVTRRVRQSKFSRSGTALTSWGARREHRSVSSKTHLGGTSSVSSETSLVMSSEAETSLIISQARQS